VADFNGDGKPDLATGNFNSSDVSVLLGNGSGGFAPATSFAASAALLPATHFHISHDTHERGVTMQARNAKFVATLAMVSAAVLAVSTGLSSASGTTTGGEVHAYEADTNDAGNLGTVILTGVITDHGTDHQGAGPNGSNRLVLSKGTF